MISVEQQVGQQSKTTAGNNNNKEQQGAVSPTTNGTRPSKIPIYYNLHHLESTKIKKYAAANYQSNSSQFFGTNSQSKTASKYLESPKFEQSLLILNSQNGFSMDKTRSNGMLNMRLNDMNKKMTSQSKRQTIEEKKVTRLSKKSTDVELNKRNASLNSRRPFNYKSNSLVKTRTETNIPMTLTSNNNNKQNLTNATSLLNFKTQHNSRHNNNQRRPIDSSKAYSVSLNSSTCHSSASSLANECTSYSSTLSLSSSTQSLSSPLPLGSNNSSNASHSSSENHRFVEKLEKTVNLAELVQFVRRYLRKIKKAYSQDQLYNCFVRNAKKMGNSNKYLALESVETFLTSTHTTKSSTKTTSSYQPFDLLNKCVKVFRRMFETIQRDLLYDLLEFEIPTINKSDESHRAGLCKRIDKSMRKVLDLNEKLSIMLNDPATSDFNLLSMHSTIPAGKYQLCKQAHYLLRFTDDIIYKFKFLLKLCEKCYEYYFVLFGNSEKASFTSGSVILKNIARKKHQIGGGKGGGEATGGGLPRLNSRGLNRTFMVEESKNETNGDEGSDSFIQETDCSSITSEDENRQNQVVTSSSPLEHVENTVKTADWSSIYNTTDRVQLLNKYYYLKSQQDSTKQNLEELDACLKSLMDRLQRSQRLEDRLRSDADLIRKTEMSLRFYESSQSSSENEASSGVLDGESELSNEQFKMQLKKQLNYLKYRHKLTEQDLKIEKICSSEINQAVGDIEAKMANLNGYLRELSPMALYIESQLRMTSHAADDKQIYNKSFPKLPPLLNQKTNTSPSSLYHNHFANTSMMNLAGGGGGGGKSFYSFYQPDQRNKQINQNYTSHSYLNKCAQYNKI